MSGTPSRPSGASASGRVEAYIRQAIFSGVYKPRQRLTEPSLARTLKCSRGPIREAILRLERDGLLEMIPRQGVFIPDVSPQSIEVVFRLRGKLEGLCVRYMREKMTADMESVLISILREMKKAAERKDPDGLLQADLRLHETIWKFSGRPQIERLLTTVMNSRGFLIARTFSASIPLKVRVKEHERYLQIVLRSPLTKVESAVEDHFTEMHTRFVNSAHSVLASL